jgi:PleD family two-component response regulator
VSISVGIAFGDEESTPEKLYERADKALYQVKENGRRGSAVAD